MSIKKTLPSKSICDNLRFFNVIHNFISSPNDSNDELNQELINALIILKKGIINGEITENNLENLQKILLDYSYICHNPRRAGGYNGHTST